MGNLFVSGLLAEICNVDNMHAPGKRGRQAGVKLTPEEKAAKCAALFAAFPAQLVEDPLPEVSGKRILGKIRDLQRDFVVVSTKSRATKPLAIMAQRRFTSAEKSALVSADECPSEWRADLARHNRANRPYNFSRNAKDVLKLVIELLSDGVEPEILRDFLEFAPPGVVPFTRRHNWTPALAGVCAEIAAGLVIPPAKGSSDPAEPAPIEVSRETLEAFWGLMAPKMPETDAAASAAAETDAAASAAAETDAAASAAAASGKASKGRAGKGKAGKGRAA